MGDTRATDSLQRGIETAKSGNNLLARLHLLQAVEAEPQNPNCWLWLAWAAESPASAMHSLERILDEHPDHELAQLGMRWAKAMAEFELDKAAEPAEEESVCEAFEESSTRETESVEACEDDNEFDEAEQENNTFSAFDDEPAEEEYQADESSDEAETRFSWAVSDSTDSAEGEFIEAEAETEEEQHEEPQETRFSWSTPAESHRVETDEEPFEDGEELETREESFEDANNSEDETVLDSEDRRFDFCDAELDDEHGEEPAAEQNQATTESTWGQEQQSLETAEASFVEPAEDESEADEEPVASESDETVAETAPEPAEEPSAFEPEVAVPDLAAAIAEDSGEGVSVLVVDDSPTVRKLVAMTLERNGFTVGSAADGVVALKSIAELKPKLILLDITMPRLGGYQLCKLIKKHESTKHIPVIMLSGKDGMFDKVRGKFVGCDDYITKPFDPEELVSKVSTQLTEHYGVTATQS